MASGGLLSAELAATCNALGYYDGNKYHLEPHCKETVKDLIRYLRRDEESNDIRRYLGNAKLIQTDLIPIIQSHPADKELFDIILRLVVNLTNPALLVYNEVIPTDKAERHQYLELISHLQGYKEAFVNHKPWEIITERLGELLSVDILERDDDVLRGIERILILVRNILHVPADIQNENRPDNDASVHDQLLWALQQSGMLDVILYIASSSQESTFYMHTLEIICLMVREQPPGLLAQTATQRSIQEKERDDQELLKIRQLEMKMKQEKVRKYHGTRHSNFGGTFVVKNMKSTSDNDIIYHKPLHTVEHITLDFEKKKMKTPKFKMALKCENVERRSALSVRLILKQFCIEILNAAYNPLMKHIKEFLVRGKTQDNDESYYFTAIRFFMEFNRLYKFQVKLVSETMSIETFHFIQKYLETWHEMMVTDKKKAVLWSTRMHISLKAYKELLQNLIHMDRSPDGGVRESSRVIKSNIFYVLEYREMLLTLINTFKKTKYSDQYLKDLAETLHIFLKILENFAKNKKLFVEKKGRNAAPHKKRNNKKSAKSNVERLTDPEEDWAQVISDLTNVMSGEISTTDVIPFDPVSEKDMDTQKVDAMKRIKKLLKSRSLQEAVAFFRASREVWPENNCFGSPEMGIEEEILCLKEVFVADLPNESASEKEESEDEEDEEEDEEEYYYNQVQEQNFNFQDFNKRFCSAKVTSICCTLLKSFEQNSSFLNHVIAKMMHRIAWECKLPAMLFQASLFRRFQQILTSNDKKYQELAKLAKYVIRKFTEVAAKNKKVFMELLFWKSATEAHEIEFGYGSAQNKSKAGKVAWEEHEEDELRRLYVEYERDKPSMDPVDWIMENMINKERSKRSVMKKLKELYLLVDKPKTQKKWTEEQENNLINLFEEFRESDDPVGNILERLSIKRSRGNIIKTLLRLGVVQDRKALHKKRKGKKSLQSHAASDDDESEQSSSEDSDDAAKGITERNKKETSKYPLPKAVLNILKELKENDYLTEGMKWLISCIEDTLEDIDDDDEAEVPLLPLSEEAIKTVDNVIFQQFLTSLGVYSPIAQQEMYWRFPGSWKSEQLTLRMKLIEFIVENQNKELTDMIDDLNSLLSNVLGTSINISSFIHEPSRRQSSDDSSSESESEMNRSERSFNEMIARSCQETIGSLRATSPVESLRSQRGDESSLNVSVDASDSGINNSKEKTIERVKDGKSKMKKFDVEKFHMKKQVKRFRSNSSSDESMKHSSSSKKENSQEFNVAKIVVPKTVKKKSRILLGDSDSEEEKESGNTLESDRLENLEDGESQEFNRAGKKERTILNDSSSDGNEPEKEHIGGMTGVLKRKQNRKMSKTKSRILSDSSDSEVEKGKEIGIRLKSGCVENSEDKENQESNDEGKKRRSIPSDSSSEESEPERQETEKVKENRSTSVSKGTQRRKINKKKSKILSDGSDSDENELEKGYQEEEATNQESRGTKISKSKFRMLSSSSDIHEKKDPEDCQSQESKELITRTRDTPKKISSEKSEPEKEEKEEEKENQVNGEKIEVQEVTQNRKRIISSGSESEGQEEVKTTKKSKRQIVDSGDEN